MHQFTVIEVEGTNLQPPLDFGFAGAIIGPVMTPNMPTPCRYYRPFFCAHVR